MIEMLAAQVQVQLLSNPQTGVWHLQCLRDLLKPILDHVLDECVSCVFVLGFQVNVNNSRVICKHMHDNNTLLHRIVCVFIVQDPQSSMSLFLHPFCVSNHTLLNHVGESINGPLHAHDSRNWHDLGCSCSTGHHRRLTATSA